MSIGSAFRDVATLALACSASFEAPPLVFGEAVVLPDLSELPHETVPPQTTASAIVNAVRRPKIFFLMM